MHHVIYEDLMHANTRVLRIKPGTPGTAILCDLVTTKIPDYNSKYVEHNGAGQQQYEALSYSWGKPDRMRIISCNNIQVPVTQNLFDALSHLRLSDRERYRWVDAICIIQNSIKERNDKVRRMLDIYKGSTRVVVW